MDSRTLKQLATIIGSGSLTRAAERLAVTQPTLTRSIQALEDRVGEAVLERSRYGVRPTAIGLRLAEIGNRILEEENQASEVLQKRSRKVVQTPPIVAFIIFHWLKWCPQRAKLKIYYTLVSIT